MSADSTLRQTAIGVFKLLREFAGIRRSPVLDINNFEDHLWLHTLPNGRDSFNRLFAYESDGENDLWFEIQRRDEPARPKAPEICIPWIPQNTPFDDQDPPSLLPQIPVTRAQEKEDPESEEQEVEDFIQWDSLGDHPDIETLWERFLDDHWLPWAEKHSEWRTHHELYSKLFGIRQTLKKAGEQFELVVGFGLLETETTESKSVRRHVLTLQAALDFNLEDGTIAVRAPLDGVRPVLEIDMLPADQRPTEEFTRRFDEEDRPQIEADPWASKVIENLLSSFTNSYPDGVFVGDQAPPESREFRFQVTLAPALILRKRTLRGMLAMFNSVIEQLEGDGPVPPSIRVIAGDRNQDSAASNRNGSGTAQLPDRIYFPKPTNQEQLEIVHRLEPSDGLLVQGPPGTGKSHTIANLICHLLATGQSVLVTAETPRALRVLAEKIPEEVRPLCVSLLGNDRESQAGLEASVKGIADRLSTWDEAGSKRKGKRLEKKFEKAIAERERIDSQLRTVREAETQPHDVANGAYSGTAQAIAEQVAGKKNSYQWLCDDVDFLAEPPLSEDEFSELVGLLRAFDDDRLEELRLGLPDPLQLLPSTPELISLVSAERQTAQEVARFNEARMPAEFSALRTAPFDQVQRTAVAFEELHQSFETANNRPLPWINKALHDVLAGDDTPWRDLRNFTADNLAPIAVAAQRADKRRVHLPADVDPMKVLADSKDVLLALNTGTSLSFFNKFSNKQFRKARYLFRETTIDGRKCESRESLLAIVEYLEVSKVLEDIWNQWIDFANSKPTTRTMQVSRLKENVEALDQVLEVHRALERVRGRIHKIGGLPEPAWHDSDQRGALRQWLRLRLAKKELETAQTRLQEIETRISTFIGSNQSHPIVKRILDSLRRRAEDDIVQTRFELTELREDQVKVEYRYSLLEKLTATVPGTAKTLVATVTDSMWDLRIDQFEEAWRWAQARSWLATARGNENLHNLNERHIRLRGESERGLEELASVRAWNTTLGRMTEQHRQHLIGWQQVMKRGGKFSGKYAVTHRQQAQEHLEACREAIPAWVMPLFHLHETIRPQPGMFDVVIVDEASQCGLDALVLMYIGKKVIIVGDDEQISPTNIGVRGDIFKSLVDRFLPGFEHASAFHADTSLFDLGSRWFQDRIVLREHFRCMPEIIRFSNDLCYKSTPLIPLRQYPPNRLEPVKARFVPEGSQRGKSSAAINEAEAHAVADALVACCNDPAYDDMEMGVISLAGEAQAKRIESLLLGRLRPEEIEKRRIVCGDSYAFQGDERHVIFLSMVNAQNDESGLPVRTRARTGNLYKQRYNVAASRAMDQLWLFHSMSLDDLPNPEDLRRTLLDFCLNGGAPANSIGDLDIDDIRRLAAYRTDNEPLPEPFDSWFEVDVFLKINDAGFPVIPQFKFAGYSIDLVVEYGPRRLAVECDGDQWHGPEQFKKDLDRQRQLERAGWTFWRIRGSEFYADPDISMGGLWKILERLNIRNRHYTPEAIAVRDEALEPAVSASAEEPVEVPTLPCDSPNQKAEPAETRNINGDQTALSASPQDQGKEQPEPEAVPRTDDKPHPNEDENGRQEGERSTTDATRPEQELSKLARSLGAKPHGSGFARSLPDPKGTDARGVQDGLVEIVRAYGPIVHGRLIRLYSEQAGYKRSGNLIREALTQQINSALRQKRFIRDFETIPHGKQIPVYRTPHQNPDPLRTAGGRQLCEIPPLEVAAVMKAILGDRAGRPVNDTDSLFRIVLEFYDFKRLTTGAKYYLKNVLGEYVLTK